jgi:hypothetical protein
MPVKYFDPKVTVKLCIIDFFLLEVKKNLNVCSAHSYLYIDKQMYMYSLFDL